MLVRNRCRYGYGVTEAEIERFVAENDVVKSFLNKFLTALVLPVSCWNRRTRVHSVV